MERGDEAKAKAKVVAASRRKTVITTDRWMRLQLHYEMQRTRIELGERINAEVEPAA